MIIRRKTKEIKIGNRIIGGDNPILIQSMTSVPTEDYAAVKSQVTRLEEAGCDIIRFAVTGEDAVKTIERLKNEETNVPLVADIHFDYRLAIACANAGIDKIRINPGNIGSDDHVRAVADICRKKDIPIRIGVNSGSLEKHILAKYGGVTAEALCESALYHSGLLEKFDFNNIVISIKASDTAMMIDANILLSERCDYPLHLGVTEAGTPHIGVVKGAIGIGSLLHRGIGDTIRVSLTADPVDEVREAQAIMKALDLHKSGIDIISCPTCGRCKVNIIETATKVEARLAEIEPRVTKKIKIAIMGCAVNGPGEARSADVGIAGGDNEFLLFKKGEAIKKISIDNAVDELLAAVTEEFIAPNL